MSLSSILEEGINLAHVTVADSSMHSAVGAIKFLLITVVIAGDHSHVGFRAADPSGKLVQPSARSLILALLAGVGDIARDEDQIGITALPCHPGRIAEQLPADVVVLHLGPVTLLTEVDIRYMYQAANRHTFSRELGPMGSRCEAQFAQARRSARSC